MLTGLSAFWFARTRDSCRTTCSACADGRSLECRRLEMLPIELVVRGYLAGSGWRTTARPARSRSPAAAGLREADRLPEPIVTPATKAESGHDLNITEAEAAELCGAGALRDRPSRRARALPLRLGARAEAGIVLADTKFEFGVDAAGAVVLGDEALTPDSSRFWPADGYRPGGPQPSFDKQFVRDFCERPAGTRRNPGPGFPRTSSRARARATSRRSSG